MVIRRDEMMEMYSLLSSADQACSLGSMKSVASSSLLVWLPCVTLTHVSSMLHSSVCVPPLFPRLPAFLPPVLPCISLPLLLTRIYLMFVLRFSLSRSIPFRPTLSPLLFSKLWLRLLKLHHCSFAVIYPATATAKKKKHLVFNSPGI